jgi:hypothetical protein
MTKWGARHAKTPARLSRLNGGQNAKINFALGLDTPG